MEILVLLTVFGFFVCKGQSAITGDATCDNIMYFYADGVQYTNRNDNDWTKSSPVSIPSDTQVVAVKCKDLHVVAGIKLALSNGIKTDTTWKCSKTYAVGWNKPGFDDSNWPNAIVPNYNWGSKPASLNGKADWIWTTGYRGQDTTVYCRKVIKKPSAQPPITGDATCDNIMYFYADGVQYTNKNDNDWTKSSPVSIPGDTQVVAVKCKDLHVVAGIKLALSNGIKTDTTWKCSKTYAVGWNKPGFDDSNWPNAIVPNYNWGSKPASLNGKADWIWTTGYRGQDTTVYCRKVIKNPSGCDCCEALEAITALLKH
ncbi:hypothetical protein SNE40_020194 [Patella caerulea]|uniref:Uncharacterized protein n=1 Tax=Patella caerulea TaxID=87958 RepID=A0AAN8G6X0_PATCE